jgi:outer membrane protein OmpA-like peptidoglycan-associated protein
MRLTAKKRPDVPVAFCYKGKAIMSRDKLLHCKKKVKHRAPYRMAPILVAAMLTGCSWVEGDEPPPAEGDGEFPNLASVPDRPDPSVFEEASLLEAGLRADRENARYDEAPLAPSTAAGVAPPPPASTAAAVPTASAAPVVTTVATPVAAVSGDVAALPPEAMPPAVTAGPDVALPPADVPAASVPQEPDNVASYSVDTPITPDAASLPPPASPVQVITRPTPVVPEPTALAAVPPSPYRATQPSPYQSAPGQMVPGQFEPGQTAPAQATVGGQVAAINPMALSRNLVAGSVLPASVVYFADGSSRVSSAEMAKVAQVAQFLASRGGYVRVVGHSSMRTGNMDRARQYQANLEVSWARANAVADALMRHGVPASAMMVSAVSDSRPIYLENIPAGEAGNRRVEIYLE